MMRRASTNLLSNLTIQSLNFKPLLRFDHHTEVTYLHFNQYFVHTKATSLYPKDIRGHLRLVEKYAREDDYKEALQHSFKVFELHKAELRVDTCNENTYKHTRQSVIILRCIVALHTCLEQYKEALSKNDLLIHILEGLGLPFELIKTRIKHGDLLIEMGMFDDAFKHFMGIEGETAQGSAARGLVYVHMAKVLYKQGEVVDSKSRLTLVSEILEKLMVEDVEAYNKICTANVYQEMGSLYENMNELILAGNMFNRGLAIVVKHPRELEHHHRWMFVLSTRIGKLLLQFEGNESLAISYLKRGVKMLKEEIDIGAKHLEIELGDTYDALGTTYLNMGKTETAVELFLKSKDITVASFGPNHRTSIGAYLNLADVYVTMER
ncbi:hypothetical protein GIB67_022622 [Kingdonia uniflora]|uniref:Uncharacterized protein n=1 Tax=Kingdonia uniflora TaxID=39325 RepID=A0A7J7P8F6_9MAGN|nr:hypothetical protein GIB67_022622 [Kingdonia uniflora]